MEIIADVFGDMLDSFGKIFQAFSSTWYWVIPVPIYETFKFLWKNHVQGQFAGSIDWILLEITPPKDIEKSPKSMESLYNGMQGTQKGFTIADEYLDGQFPVSFSLEMVSDGGEVHLYIRTQRNFRNLIEAHLYAQYPDCIITEVPDYVDDIPKIVPNSKWDLWGTDLQFTKDDAYPIKTYKNFEESVTGKMIDPLASVLETLGKLPPGQKIWFQIVISAHDPSWASKKGKGLLDILKGKASKKSKGFFDGLGNDLGEILSGVVKGAFFPVEFSAKSAEKKDEQPLEFKLSPGEREVLKVVEENLGKPQFNTKMRFVLVGKRENFDKSNVSSFMGAMRQFADENLNGFKPNSDSKTYANYILRKPRLRYRQRKIITRYRERSSDGVCFTMSTEELATVFHMPDMQVVAPSLVRVDAKRGGAPANLPIE